MNLLAIKFDDAFPLDVDGFEFTFVNTPFILVSSSATVFVTPVTISNGAPFLPMKNIDGNGTSLSRGIFNF